MSQIAVYSFDATDRETGQDVAVPRMATPETIKRLKGIARLDSRRLVSESEIDPEGFYLSLYGTPTPAEGMIA